ncbi:MAG: hypothetical protein R3Y09_08145 [Clostridia bacterium]
MNDSKNISLASLICGILGIAGGWIPVVQNFTLVLTVVAIIFGNKCLKMPEATPNEILQAKIGKYLGIAGIIVTICVYIYTFVLIASYM